MSQINNKTSGWSQDPFDEEDPGERVQQQQLKFTKTRQGRSAPLVFSNPFLDDVGVNGQSEEDFDRVTNLRSSSVHSNLQHNNYNYPTSVGEADSRCGEETTMSEISPLLPDDLSRGYQSSNRTTSPKTGRISIPTKIFTGSHRNKRMEDNKSNPQRHGRKKNNSNSNDAKSNIILKELASGDDHEQDIHMEYKLILLEDLGTASSWVILVLPYATFFLSIVIENSTSLSLSNVGPISTALRMFCFFFTFGFIVYWARQFEIRYCCYCGGCFRYFFGLLRSNISKNNEDQQRKPVDMYWWENPWVLFPERYYVLPLLLSLLLVHEPVRIAIYYISKAESVPQKNSILYAVSDASAGAGVEGILLIYLCLLEGFRFHTGERSKQRAEHQRKALQLRQAVKFIEDDKHKHKEFISSPRVVENYYEEYGDLDGSAFTEHLRLPNDPLNSSACADFLLPKIILWIVGVLAVTMVAYTQLSYGKTTTTRNSNLTKNDTMYIIGSLIYGSTIVVWMYLIIIALYSTGETLRREPFLGTRPAQLAYRILFAHSALAIVAFGISSIKFIQQLQGVLQGQSILAIVKKGNIGFSGMFGRLISVTVQVVITAFIFLPPHTMDSEEDGDEDDNNERTELQILSKNKRDKRLVVHLAKHSKTCKVLTLCYSKEDNR